MPRRSAQILEDARQLPPTEREWLIGKLLAEVGPMSDEAFAAWRKEVGEPEPGYDEWFRAGVEEALADTEEGIPHEQAMKQFHDAIARARKMKRTA